jgi:hypothetical protein
MIVNNIVEEFGDDPSSISGFNGKEDDDVGELYENLRAPRHMDADNLYRAGLA